MTAHRSNEPSVLSRRPCLPTGAAMAALAAFSPIAQTQNFKTDRLQITAVSRGEVSGMIPGYQNFH